MKNPGKAGITEEEKQRRLEMHCSGMKNVEIAEALGISAQAVSSWLRRQRGVAQKPRKSVPRGKPLVPEEFAVMRERLREVVGYYE